MRTACQRLFFRRASSSSFASGSTSSSSTSGTPLLKLRLRPSLKVAATVAAAAVPAAIFCADDRKGEVDSVAQWDELWRKNWTPFHLSNVNPILSRYYDRWIKGELSTGAPASGERPHHRVFVPLCGKTVDMLFLADHGHEVVGIEGSSLPIRQFQQENQGRITMVEKQVVSSPLNIGTSREQPGVMLAEQTFRVFSTATNSDSSAGIDVDVGDVSITIIQGDYFKLNSAVAGTFDKVWDRGSLVAINPEDREKYVEVMKGLIRPGGDILLVTSVYDTSVATGPPHSIDEAEVRRLYETNTKGAFQVRLLEAFAAPTNPGALQGKIAQVMQHVFLITKKRS